MQEEWKRIEECPWYSVSNEGRVRRSGSDRMLAVCVATGGNPYVNLYLDHGAARRGLAKLVAEAFVPYPEHRIDVPTPIHVDGDKMNCRADNLMWRPRWFAQKYARQFTWNLQNPNPVRNIDTGVVYENIWDVVFEQGVLFNDVIKSSINKTYVFPLFQCFEWVDGD